MRRAGSTIKLSHCRERLSTDSPAKEAQIMDAQARDWEECDIKDGNKADEDIGSERKQLQLDLGQAQVTDILNQEFVTSLEVQTLKADAVKMSTSNVMKLCCQRG